MVIILALFMTITIFSKTIRTAIADLANISTQRPSRTIINPYSQSIHRKLLSHDLYHAPAAGTELQTSKQYAVFLHGILGSKRNWRSGCLAFQQNHPQYHALAVDHRGHGNSPHSMNGDINTISNCANDIQELFENVENHHAFSPPQLICAHSFGGKVALQYMKMLMENDFKQFPKDIWVLDSLPGAYVETDPSHPYSVSYTLNTINDLPRVFPSRQWLMEELIRCGISKMTAQWIATNVIPSEEIDPQTGQKMVQFCFDIQTILDLFDDYKRVDLWDFLHHYDHPTTKIHFIRAGKNNNWTPDVLSRFDEVSRKNPSIQLHHMPHVGHLLHAEDLHGVLNIISSHSQMQ